MPIHPNPNEEALDSERSESLNPENISGTSTVFVADTSLLQSDRGGTSVARLASRSATTDDVTIREITANYHRGPLPDPQTLREFKEIYTNAPKMTFEDFHAQSAHRRAIELSVISTKNILALRGQIIAAVIGTSGVVGGFVCIIYGHEVFGLAATIASVGSLAALFIYGREDQKKERIQKEIVREKIRENRPIEELEREKEPSS